MLSKKSLQSIQECMYGYQKQANATNQAVAYLICKELDRVIAPAEFNNSSEAADAIVKYLNHAMYGNGVKCDDKIVSLIVGVPGCNLAMSGKHCQVRSGVKNPDSPKYIFLIDEIQVEESEEENPRHGYPQPTRNITNDATALSMQNTGAEVKSSINIASTPLEMAEHEKNQILALVPESRRSTFEGNDWAAALFFAKAYYTK